MNKKIILSVLVVAACIALGAVSLQGSVVPKVRFADLPKHTERVKAYGILDKQSIQSVDGATTVAFKIEEEGTGVELNVLYDNPYSALPSNFPAASHALVTGAYDPVAKRLVADSVLTKCPSKYQEENSIDTATQSVIDRWNKQTGRSPAGS